VLVGENMAINPMFSPLLSIWLKPRETIQDIIQGDASKPLMYAIIILSGIGALRQFSFFISLILGPPLVAAGVLFLSYALIWTGRLFKGQGAQKNMFKALAWTLTPMALHTIFYILLSLLMALLPFAATFFGVMLVVVSIFCLLFTIYVGVNAIAVVQGFGVWRAAGNYLLGSSLLGLAMAALRALLGI
jgi:hypothetical protein